METEANRTLDDCKRGMHLLQSSPNLGKLAIGDAAMDARAWRHGRDWLLENRPCAVPVDGGPDVYLASTIYPNGGHTALIGDFTRALGSERAWLILTNQESAGEVGDWEKSVVRTGVPEERAVRLREASLDGKMAELFDRLLEIKPGRLFLFHHPDDPLACAVAQPEVAPIRVLVHHADAMPTFGLHVPGLRLIDLNPFASAASRSQNLAPALLLLSCPDPGPRNGGFLSRGHLVTATCGSGHKYGGDHAIRYSETVGVILRTTGGWHYHFGPLDEGPLSEIAGELRRLGIAEDRFVHRPWVPNLTAALWECGCDLYLASFPISGARAITEVVSASVPHIRHAKSGKTERQIGHFGGLTWQSWEDLAETLRSVANPESLEALSLRSRAYFDRWHHPEVFRHTLLEILHGGEGIVDPDAAIRERRAAECAHQAYLVEILDRTYRLESKIRFLQEKRREQHEKIRSLNEAAGRLKKEIQELKPKRGFWRRIFGRGKRT